ncbi:biliverdin-producing heme oxygenase [Rhizobium sp. PAMB 3182]
MLLIEALRAETAGLHGRLDCVVSRADLASREGYGRFLMMHARLLPALEYWLSGQDVFRTLPFHQERGRLAALKSDLQEMGLDAPREEALPYLNRDLSVEGVCYVLEGSRLGAAHIRAQQDKAGGSLLPQSFLRHGEGRGLWKSFMAWLSARDQSDAAAGQAVSAASLVFGSYLSAARVEAGLEESVHV